MTVTYEWSAIIERLQYHRERLGVNKVFMAKLIKQHYQRCFWHLSDAEVVGLGTILKDCNTIDDLMQKLPKQTDVLMEDKDIFNGKNSLKTV